MSTAVSNYDTEKRSRAAKMGWVWRRAVRTPEEIAKAETRLRFHMAMKAADPCRARLYVCDVAQAVQHHYLAVFPGDTRTLDALALARTIASDTPPTAYRLRKMRTRIIEQYRHFETRRSENTPAYRALQAAGFALSTSIAGAIEWGLAWADSTNDPASYYWHPDYTRHTPALEALAR
jgi:hypothetical protein